MAISGGPDSTALLLALAASGHDVVAAHFDHALREDSAADADFVRALAAEHRIPLVESRRTEPLARGSIQAAARAARYRFLEDARARANAVLIVTAHTRDDQVETIVMNLLRGTGVDGLRGIPPQRGSIIRPLLNVGRADVEDYLRLVHPKVIPRDDPSNRNLRYLRARLRHLALPYLRATTAQVDARLLRIASLASRAHDRISAAAALDAPEPAARAAALRALYAAGGGAPTSLGRSSLLGMDGLLRRRRTGAALDLPGGLSLVVLPDGGAVCERRAASDGYAVTTVLREHPCSGCAAGPQIARATAEAAIHVTVPGPLAVRTRWGTPGLRIHTRAGTKKLQDIFVDAKIPRRERDSYPLVFAGDRLIWVPNLAADPACTSPTTLPGRHVSIEIGAKKPVVRSDDQSS